MKTIGCIIARTASKRLPRKVLKEIHGKKMIEYIIQKMKRVHMLDALYLCTTVDSDDKVLLDIARKHTIKGYAGSRTSVIDRMLDVAEMEHADAVVRITGDNVFTDEIFLERMIQEQEKNMAVDYTRTEYVALGVTAEVISVNALKRCRSMIGPAQGDHLLLYMFNPEAFTCQVLVPEQSLMAEFTSLTVDIPDDIERTSFLVERLYRNGRIYYDDIIALSRQIEIPHFKIQQDAMVKISNEKAINYNEFRRVIMKERIARSKKIFLEKDFYKHLKNK